MAFNWAEGETIKLLILYGQYDCLKYPFDDNFDKKMYRYKAYKHIVDAMNIPSLTIYDCITKIEDLKKQYCYELSKIAVAILCGKLYESQTKYFKLMHDLFFPFVNCDQKVNIIQNEDKITKDMVKDVCTEIDLIEEKKDDEFDMFAKSIAYQLRNISLKSAIELEKKIQDLVTEERLSNIKRSLSSDNIICCCSCSNCVEIRQKNGFELQVTTSNQVFKTKQK
ncbi:uncharacterized protein LOC122635607 [Vespula pensylvanica]|uniref:uncharacterized protein LOC122635607 n=1 Tax=Vespula pensylvanica TaxID=30213 RepID=UPI001CB9FF0A|nr:uncharacterized protein LOC122635607 [Vespula pensylvanica]